MAGLLKEDLLGLKTAPGSEVANQRLSEAKNGAVGPAGKRAQQKSEKAELRELLKPFLEELIADSAREDRGIEVRQVAGGYRMSTTPEHHDVIRTFAKSHNPAIPPSLPAPPPPAAVPENVTEPTVSSDPHHDESDEQAADQIASESNGG